MLIYLDLEDYMDEMSIELIVGFSVLLTYLLKYMHPIHGTYYQLHSFFKLARLQECLQMATFERNRVKSEVSAKPTKLSLQDIQNILKLQFRDFAYLQQER